MKFFVINKKEILFIIFIIFLFILLAILFLISGKVLNVSTDSIEPNIEKIKNIYDSNEKIAYLTFDDGPTKKVTPKILDILKQNNINATFFVIGKRVDENPEIIKRAYNEGNFIANHTYSHNNNKIYINKETFLTEIQKTDESISNAIGIDNYHSGVFRFPNGSTAKDHYLQKQNSIKYLEEINYGYLDWNALNNDSMQKLSKKQLLENLKNTSKGKDVLVILMHDSGDVNNTYDVLQDSINYLKSQGCIFKTLYDVLYDCKI